MSRTLLAGGVSAVHDPLLAAALRGRGVRAEALVAPGATALATGRALLARGHCNPVYYLAGALVEQVRAGTARDPAARFAHVTAGSCGPCRFATYAGEYRRALAGAGLPDVPVVAIEQDRPRPAAALDALGVRVDARLLAQLARAALAGDVLVHAGCERRPAARDPAAVDAALDAAREALAIALAHGRPLAPVMAALRRALDALPARTRPPAPRVLVTGAFFAAHTGGHGGYQLVRRLEALGAVVRPAAVATWLAYLAWQAGRPSLERIVRGLHARLAAAAGVAHRLHGMDDLAALAAPHYPPALRGGAGHLEVAELLAADRDGTAELVVSIKPFGCLPSSAVSDGILPVLARRARRVAFVSIETTGDGEAQVDSRLALALETAMLPAAGGAAGLVEEPVERAARAVE